MSDPVLHIGVGASKCRSCQKPIVFASTTSGKLAPFEADPAGLWTIVNGVAKYLGAPPTEAPQQSLTLETPPPRFTSHFATCAQAKQWRNSRDE